MDFFVLCTKIKQDFHGVMSIRPPLPCAANSLPPNILKLKLPSSPLPPTACCPLPAPATTFEEDDHACVAGVNIEVAGVNIAVEAHDL
jgi:hypothetical protein